MKFSERRARQRARRESPAMFDAAVYRANLQAAVEGLEQAAAVVLSRYRARLVSLAEHEAYAGYTEQAWEQINPLASAIDRARTVLAELDAERALF